MTAYRRQFDCRIVTMEGKNLKFDAVSVVFPVTDGLMGVLGGRAPLIASIGEGQLSIEAGDGARREFFLAGGFARVQDDVMTIMADLCQPAEELQLPSAKEELEQAARLPARTPAQAAVRQKAVRAARARVRLALARLQTGKA